MKYFYEVPFVHHHRKLEGVTLPESPTRPSRLCTIPAAVTAMRRIPISASFWQSDRFAPRLIGRGLTCVQGSEIFSSRPLCA